MDEVSFGPSREDRPPSRRRRALTIAFSAAGVAAAGAALAALAPSAYHALASRYTIARPAAPSASPARLPSPGCRPVHPDWPSLAGLPAGMRPGALPVIADAQFSGRCSLASAGAGSACRGSRGRVGRRTCPRTGVSRRMNSVTMRRPAFRAAERVWHDLRFGDLHRRGKEFELMYRAMGFAALSMLTVFPLLVIVAAAGAATHHGIAVWVVYGMGLTGSSARAVILLFSAPAKVLSTTSVFSLVLLALFGVTFAGSVQAGFERVWGLPAGPWHKIWRQVVWLVVFIAYIYAAATVGGGARDSPAETVIRVLVAAGLGVIFFWWGLRFLVGGRVSYLAAMPAAVVTVAFLAGLRVFSALVFQPLVVANAVTYGALGTVLIVQSWLIGVGWVVYGGQLFGCWFHDAWLAPWAENRRGRGQPGGKEPGSAPEDP